jgi:hypothetical protein
MRKVDTYERFHRHIAAWLDREIDPVLVVGPPGVGKSHAYATRLGNRPYHRFGGRQTPLHVYKSLHDDPHLPVVLDDISALLQDDCFRDMLKGLCESGERNLHWGTTTSKLEGRTRSFCCTSPVLIVMNKIPSRDADVAAILDRCDAIEFAPTKSEVIIRMRELFPADAELIDLIAELPTLPSLRTLIKARRWQNSRHLKLVEELLAECGAPQAVVHLARIIENHPENEWCARYLAETGLTDRTYRRHKRLALQLVDCRASPQPCPDVRGCVPDRSSTAADESNGCDTQL